jgi:hypothetical protein
MAGPFQQKMNPLSELQQQEPRCTVSENGKMEAHELYLVQRRRDLDIGDTREVDCHITQAIYMPPPPSRHDPQLF